MQAATGEDVTPEELGGAELHCSTSGVADHLAESEDHAISITRNIVANLNTLARPSAPQPPVTALFEEPLHPPDELRGEPCHLLLHLLMCSPYFLCLAICEGILSCFSLTCHALLLLKEEKQA